MNSELSPIQIDVTQREIPLSPLQQTRLSRLSAAARRQGNQIARVGVATAAILGGTLIPRDQATSQGVDCAPVVPTFDASPMPATADSVGVSEYSSNTEIRKMTPEAAVLAYDSFKTVTAPFLNMDTDASYWAQFNKYTPEELSERIEMTTFEGGYGAQWKFRTQAGNPQALPEVVIQQTWGEHGNDTFLMQANRDTEGNITSDEFCQGYTYASRVSAFKPGDPTVDLDLVGQKVPIIQNRYAVNPETQWKPVVWSEEMVGKQRKMYDMKGRQVEQVVLKSGETNYVVTIPEIRRLNNAHR